jgi:hypothetical protein
MKEITLKATNSTEQRVLQYLQENASDALAEKINAGTKTIAGALKHAKDEARKLADGESSICVEDATVYGWIIHYFEEEGITEKAKKPAFVTPAGVATRGQPELKKAAKTMAVPVKDQKSMFAELLG